MLELLSWIGLGVVVAHGKETFRSRIVAAIMILGAVFTRTTGFEIEIPSSFEDIVPRVVWLVAVGLPLTVFLGTTKNRRVRALKYVAALGFTLNSLVILANDGKMPVAGGGNTVVHGNLTDKTKFPLLADRFNNRWVIPGTFSTGDVLIYSGIVATALQMLRRERNS